MPVFPHQLIQRSEPEGLLQACAELLEQRLRQRLTQVRPRPLGLATGRTMEPLYLALVARLLAWPPEQLAALQRSWLSFNLDDYVGLSWGDPAGYRHYMRQRLADPLGLSDDQLRLPDGHTTDPAAAAQAYGEALAAAGDVGVQLLGLGSNGHVGFNEPPCGADAICRVVELSPATRQQNAELFGGAAENVPARAITLGLREILAAEEIHLVVTGAAKAGILQRLLDSCPDPGLPASWLRQHPRVWIWADAAALA
ncbi:MAG: glucosamine-6-phosphate deaminase [Synechococcus sp.]|nr:glucosamine-6-phosphate deaminase [Synechococcus sp.]